MPPLICIPPNFSFFSMTSKFMVNRPLFLLLCFMETRFVTFPAIERYTATWLPQTPKYLTYIALSLSLSLSPSMTLIVAKLDIHFPMFLSIITISSFLLTILPLSHSEEDDYFRVCNSTYNCGNLTNISYPFWGQNRFPYCGSSDRLKLNCEQNDKTFIQVDSQTFTVLWINQFTYTMRMVRRDLVSSSCPSHFTNTSLNPPVFNYPLQTVHNMTVFYNCSPKVSNSSLTEFNNSFTCQNESERDKQAFYVNETQLQKYPELLGCGVQVQVPVLRDVALGDEGGIQALKQVLEHGFDVQYLGDFPHCIACYASGGMCGSVMSNTSQFSCHCRDGPHDFTCPHHRNHIAVTNRVIIGITGVIVGALLICIAIFCSRCKASKLQRKYWMMTKNDQNIEAFIRNHGALALKRYKFSDVKKMTNSFKVKLGQGGFGAVYKGELLTGCSVAVKILNGAKGNGEDFINEVASISRTSHVNIVTLLGFCIEGRKKALIYEFMPNGSLEKFIYNKDAEASPVLSWENLHHIAVGIARGLEYLHRGCNTRILHFDIKPHNILLDEDFCPKISDFGLAKLCPSRESIISMSDARGTLGYVAPEVWNRNFGGVSHKSDVYSYGMMLLEMVGGRKNINVEVSCTSEIYYPYWIHKNLEMGNSVVLRGVTTTEESGIAKKMILVGLWCVQTIPTDRPAISRVIEMLEGSINSLQMPPKPSMSSPPRSAAESSTA